MAEDAPANSAEQKPKKKLPIKTIIVILSVMLLEGGTITFFKVAHDGPQPAQATDPIAPTEKAPGKDMVEVVLADNMNVDNYSMGAKARLVITLEVVARAQRTDEPQLTQSVTDNGTAIKDKIRTMVSSAEPTHIRDAKLEVIKREIKTGVETIIGEGIIKEILLPVWQSYPAD